MSDISKALQGKSKNRKGQVKDQPERQLDLFSSLSDSSSAQPRRMKTKPPASPDPEPAAPKEVEMILPPADEPPDVSADVRSVLSESRPVRPVDPSSGTRPPLRTGIYRRPQRPTAAPPPPKPSHPPSGPRRPLLGWITDFFSGMELNRRMVSLVLVLVVLVALIATWTACPRGDREDRPGTLLDLTVLDVADSTAVPAPKPVPSDPVPVAEKPPEKPAENWNVKGTVAMLRGDTIHVRFEDAVFVSSDKISVKGMRALKAVAKKLLTMKEGARITVIGHTDDVPLTKPTLQFRSNKELAELRSKVALDHLRQFSRKNKALEFTPETGAPSEAPYPNDTSAHRRLNRTVTLNITPAP